MFGMTMAFAAAGIGQVYLERILGFGYLETQAKIQVHFLMLVATGTLFTAGVALFLWDFFFLAPRQRAVSDAPMPSGSDDSMRRESPGVLRPAEQTSGERLHGHVALSGRRGAVLPGDRRRDRGVRDLPRARPSGDAQRADRLRQDPVRRAHGLASAAAARHRRLPRRSVGQRPHGPLPDSRRRHGLARRPADARGAARRHLLPRRDHRGAAGYGRRHPSADRRSPHPAARQDRRDRGGRARLPAGHLLQPGLPARRSRT